MKMGKDMKRRNMNKRFISTLAAVVLAVSASGTALTASAYSVTKNSPAIYYLKTDTVETDKSGEIKSGGKILRKGFYTGYPVNDNAVMIAVGYGYKILPRKSLSLKYKSSFVNSINMTGAFSQLSGKKRVRGDYNGFPYGCGPSSASTLITYELSRPYNNTIVRNTDIISYYRSHPKEAAGFLFSGTLKTWCLEDGTTNYGVKKIVSDYSKKYGKKGNCVAILDPADMSSPLELVNKIDLLLRTGRRVIVTVRCSSDEGGNGTVNKYVKKKCGTHYIVIAAENGFTDGRYFICDPWYVEGEPYAENGLNYYYGMQYSKKLKVAASMMNAGGDLERSLIYVK